MLYRYEESEASDPDDEDVTSEEDKDVREGISGQNHSPPSFRRLTLSPCSSASRQEA